MDPRAAQRRRERLALIFWAILSGSVIATLVGLLAGAMLWGLVGEVHDENAVVLGGVAAHAGLFGTVDDLARLGRALLANLTERVLLSPVTLSVMIENQTGPEARGLTWQGRDRTGSPAGDLVGPATFGHTGFTGTSLFVDPALGRYFVLLTNRVHPNRAGVGIQAVRRAFHNVAVGSG